MDFSNDKQAKSHTRKFRHGKKGNRKRETKSLLIAALNNDIRTSCVKTKIDPTK